MTATPELLDASLFYLFSLLALAGGILCITRRNAVLSAVWLVVSLLGVAGLFLLEGAEFLFVAQIIVYIGGITLLFLFVIMLVNLDAAAIVRQFRRSWPAIVLAGLVLAAELMALLVRGRLPPIEENPISAGNTEQLADTLFSHDFVAFELVSVLLLIAIVGSVWMGQRRPEREASARDHSPGADE
jgi:NADH-quinone oxidoreductase subunit J